MSLEFITVSIKMFLLNFLQILQAKIISKSYVPRLQYFFFLLFKYERKTLLKFYNIIVIKATSLLCASKKLFKYFCKQVLLTYMEMKNSNTKIDQICTAIVIEETSNYSLVLQQLLRDLWMSQSFLFQLDLLVHRRDSVSVHPLRFCKAEKATLT